jgi:arylsulfatase A-like enzyme
MDDASAWLADGINADGEGRPLLAVLHARGGHPPWEVKPDEAERLPPADYTGYFSARRAAQILAKLQGRHSRLSEQDTERMRALFHAGLSRQDEALGKLIRRLEDLGIWDTTLFIVVGDVASGRRQLFQDGLDLDESILTVPLYVHFPGGALAGTSVNQPTEIYDVTQTLLASLGLKAPPDMLGRDLFTLASGGEDADRIRAAITADAYSVRWGDYALHGKFDETPALCDLLADPTCAYDRRDRYPLVTQALYRRFARIASSRPPAAEREPLTLDAEAAAMLEVWGVY